MYTLYDTRLSGNSWKVRLLLQFLQRPFERKTLVLNNGDTRTPEFLRLNPIGRVPVLVLEDGTAIAESNAILLFLAKGTPWLPSDPVEEARVLQWLFFEQYDHLRFFARPRLLVAIAKLGDACGDEVSSLRKVGQPALDILESQLSKTRFLIGEHCTIADIALFPYTSMAELGGYDLQPFEHLRAWVARMQALPRFEPLLVD